MAQGDTPLALALKARIRTGGPISVAEYMRACLTDPEHGYYAKRPAIGAAGDFITAPEISQIFGEIIGLWSAVVWEQMGRPAPRLVELGPGRGTLMRDVLRTTRRIAEFHAALTVDLVESNATLRAMQQDALRDETVPIRWHDSANALTRSAGGGGTILLANEFLDALPVEQLVFSEGEWWVRGVTLLGTDDFAFCTMDPAPQPPSLVSASPEDGDVFETRTGTAHLMRTIADRLAKAGPFAALLIDYGHDEPGIGDTLQAVQQQKYVSLFEAPGLCDLSAHVDFAAVAAEARSAGLAVDGPVSQGEFLGALGALERASQLMAANPDKAAAIEAAAARLMSPNGMGSRFKAIGLRSAELPVLPGLVRLDNAGQPA
jgi:NADH dehydrogenase [ubiquinone] 1 alpha subcomplex assembly factor 7